MYISRENCHPSHLITLKITFYAKFKLHGFGISFKRTSFFEKVAVQKVIEIGPREFYYYVC